MNILTSLRQLESLRWCIVYQDPGIEEKGASLGPQSCPPLLWGNRDSEGMSDSPKVTQLRRGPSGHWTQAYELPVPCSSPSSAALRVFFPGGDPCTCYMQPTLSDLRILSNSHQREPQEASRPTASRLRRGIYPGHCTSDHECASAPNGCFPSNLTFKEKKEKKSHKNVQIQEICWNCQRCGQWLLQEQAGMNEAGTRDESGPDCWECD